MEGNGESWEMQCWDWWEAGITVIPVPNQTNPVSLISQIFPLFHEILDQTIAGTEAGLVSSPKCKREDKNTPTSTTTYKPTSWWPLSVSSVSHSLFWLFWGHRTSSSWRFTWWWGTQIYQYNHMLTLLFLFFIYCSFLFWMSFSWNVKIHECWWKKIMKYLVSKCLQRDEVPYRTSFFWFGVVGEAFSITFAKLACSFCTPGWLIRKNHSQSLNQLHISPEIRVQNVIFAKSNSFGSAALHTMNPCERALSLNSTPAGLRRDASSSPVALR